MKNLYCSHCHLPLKMIRKALPKYATIVELVDPHTCLAVPVEFNFELANKGYQEEYKPDKSTINPKGFGMSSTSDLRDRRFEPEDPTIKSSAPGSILSMIDQMANTQPSKPLTDLPNED